MTQPDEVPRLTEAEIAAQAAPIAEPAVICSTCAGAQTVTVMETRPCPDCTATNA